MGSEGPPTISIHITGFKKFHGVAENSTEFIVNNLHKILKKEGVQNRSKLAIIADGNPDRLVDGVNTIGMLLTSTKVNTTTSYLSGLAEDEGRDPDYFSLLVSGRDKGMDGGWVVQPPLTLIHQCMLPMERGGGCEEIPIRYTAQGSPGFKTAPPLNGIFVLKSLCVCVSHEWLAG
eukprot:Gb_08398 [translate_table: standard]